MEESKKEENEVVANTKTYEVKFKGKSIYLTQKEILLKIPQYQRDIQTELTKLNSNINKVITKPNVYLQQLSYRKEFIKWTNIKFRLNFNGKPNKVFKREVFYCELGENIGSEQGGRRPVVILQNDIANSNSNTTIVAPITTHHGIVVKEAENYVINFTDNYGNKSKKTLGFYEIPIQIEDGFRLKIIGFVNIAHLKEIDKKRLDNAPVAKVTEENLKEINEAIKINMEI